MPYSIPKPFSSAHRAGNSREAVLAAIEAGADLIETDIWLHRGRLELRHAKRYGCLPLLWEGWSPSPGWLPRYTLRDLLEDVPDDALIFLDFKGRNMALGPMVLKELQEAAPDRTVAICGRNYPQLDTISDDPRIITFYSVGTESEWPEAQRHIEASSQPALSLLADLATPEKLQWMRERNGTTVCWGVHSQDQMERLQEMGVDGFTTESSELMLQIQKLRRALPGEDT